MTRDEIIKLAREAGIEWQGGFVRVAECVTQPMLERFAAMVAAAEREACAQVCDDIMAVEWTFDCQWEAARRCAQTIRARGCA